MYDKNSQRDWLNDAVTAMIGASLAAMFSVSQGRDPLIAFILMTLAVGSTLLVSRYFSPRKSEP